MSAPGKYIGTVPCKTKGCSEVVRVKLNRGGRAYGKCDRCTCRFEFDGVAHSQRFVREEVTLLADPYDDNPGNPGETVPPGGPTPAADPKQTPEKPRRRSLLAGTPFEGL
ncbi:MULTISPECIES: hypothetical protein [unclassified Burkholderia]|uniref:hypothetical protein n=1 Tax=unclassified Burkholderia TaxID=2613784 RepID=UPI000F591C13|nr:MULTISPECIES: hypothetical protein [unclassified Burkholderia]RQS17485.1 hypothetical protein DIE05_37360 [Burkholderia sp. Bp8995]RQS37892.1 hypothetical protein DIE00_37235 [Burkholderia sp. Bp8989]